VISPLNEINAKREEGEYLEVKQTIPQFNN
jgi:hypothetical protein